MPPRSTQIWDAVYAHTFAELTPKAPGLFRTVDFCQITDLAIQAANAAVRGFYLSQWSSDDFDDQNH